MLPEGPHTLAPHTAHRLAVKLRQAGIYTTGKDIMDWSFHTCRLAILWVEQVHGTPGAESWESYMGAHLPPPSQQSWLPFSAGKPPREAAGSE